MTQLMDNDNLLDHGDAAGFIPIGLDQSHPLNQWAIHWSETRTGRWEGSAVAVNEDATPDPHNIIRARIIHAADLPHPVLDPDEQPITDGWMVEVEECGGWSGPPRPVASLLDAFTWAANRVGSDYRAFVLNF